MDYLAPPLRVALELRAAIENGNSVFAAAKSAARLADGEFAVDLAALLVQYEQGQTQQPLVTSKSPYRKMLIGLLAAGLKGEPILKNLIEIEDEIKMACEQEMQEFVQKLPFKALVPVLLMQFPAFLLLVLGPILNEMIAGLNS